MTGDGALGFWKALRQVYGAAREQRCWVHKTGNISNKLPKGLQNKAKGHLQDIWMAETRKDAETALLRLPRRALEACADDEPHREHLRHGSPSHLSDQGLPVTQDGDGHGLQALPGGQQEMAEAQWIRSVRRDHSRRQIREWRTPGSRRRMTNPYTTFDNSSRISRTVLSAGSFLLIDFCLIFVPFGHYDEPEILRYAITSICPKGADVRQYIWPLHASPNSCSSTRRAWFAPRSTDGTPRSVHLSSVSLLFLGSLVAGVQSAADDETCCS